MVVVVASVGLAAFAGVAAGSPLGGRDINAADIAAMSQLVLLLGLVFDGVALALGATAGRTRIATCGTCR